MPKIMFKNICVIGAKNNEKALAIKNSIVEKYNFFDATENHKNLINCDLIIAVGGDGLMLHLLHEFEENPVPIYGINAGTIGFLMNANHHDLLQAINNANISVINPLKMLAKDKFGKQHILVAINEVSLFRQTNQASKIQIEVNDLERLSCLIADGVLLSTSAGSTAYNFSAGGPIIPFGAKILALTAISPFRPRKWNGALLPSNSKVKFKVLENIDRPVSATADSFEVRDVIEVEVYEDSSKEFKILFDSSHSLEDRIIREQFNHW